MKRRREFIIRATCRISNFGAIYKVTFPIVHATATLDSCTAVRLTWYSWKQQQEAEKPETADGTCEPVLTLGLCNKHAKGHLKLIGIQSLISSFEDFPLHCHVKQSAENRAETETESEIFGFLGLAFHFVAFAWFRFCLSVLGFILTSGFHVNTHFCIYCPRKPQNVMLNLLTETSADFIKYENNFHTFLKLKNR